LIPSNRSRKHIIRHDKVLCCGRNRVERCFKKLKRFFDASPPDCRACHVLAFLCLADTMLWMDESEPIRWLALVRIVSRAWAPAVAHRAVVSNGKAAGRRWQVLRLVAITWARTRTDFAAEGAWRSACRRCCAGGWRSAPTPRTSTGT
jgi:hypothetical protein